ncbi:ATP-binding protein [Streptomyces sp. P1-3]|uniref:ATP-binding protein n=1 Tax=Streptomyces sp. P1-3 TaxID=3421658 RepID=UPI003D35AD76
MREHTEEGGAMRLYARDPILRALVPRLLGLAYDKRNLVAQEHRDDLPVVLLTGRHGMGKTAVLDALETAYRGRVPLGRADSAEVDPARWAGFAVSNTSPVLELLEQLVCELAAVVPGTSRLRFPRLLPGLFAISSWHRGNEHEQRLARDRIARLIAACGLEKGDERTDTGMDWMSDVSERLADTDQQYGLEPVAAAVIQQYFSRHTRTRAGRAVREWYHERSAGTADGEAALIRLSLRFHQGGAFRHAVERLLTSALIEDVSDAYGRWQRMNRTPKPLILLDNVHTAAGRRVLDLILEHRAGRGSDDPDPLVVVATRLGGGADLYPDASHSELPELSVASGWERTAPGSPSAGLLTVPLAPLSLDDLLMMLDRAEGPLHRRLPSALHTLARGHPLGSGLLCDAIVHTNAQRPVLPEDLLDLCTAEGRSVTERLLAQLIPPPQLRDHLALLSLARDRDAAEALAAAYAVSGADPLPVAAAARYLEEEQWTDRPDEVGTPGHECRGTSPFAPDPFLHALLVHAARNGSAAAGPGRRWSDLHRILREHHTALGAGDSADILRHTLAAGDARPVVIQLTAHFADGDADRWLRTLRHVATAPHPPRAEWTDHRLEIARGDHDHRYAEADDVRRSVNRLLHGLWYLCETYAEPFADICDGIGSELAFLSMRHTSGRAALNQASRTWPTSLRREPPC